MQKSVVHLSFSSAGGAGGVAKTLAEAQHSLGMSAHLVSHISSTLWARPLSAPLHTLAAGLDEFVVKNKHFNAPISLYRDRLSGSFSSSVTSADVIHLHGINGFVDLARLGREVKDKPIVWTLHDMNPFTGACHYSLGCEGYLSGCHSCPAVKAGWRDEVTRNVSTKIKSAASLPHLRMVAPSTWLKSLVEGSPMAPESPVTVIGNPIRDEFFSTPAPPRRTNSTAAKFLVIAQNLNDPVKDVSFALKAFARVQKHLPEAELVLVGKGGERLQGNGIRRIERLSTSGIIAELDTAAALVVSSVAENAPLVIAEAASRGCPAVVRNVGGMPDMVNNLGHGVVFNTHTELAEALISLGNSPLRVSQRESLRRAAKKLHSPSSAAKAYGKVYEAATAGAMKRKGR